MLRRRRSPALVAAALSLQLTASLVALAVVEPAAPPVVGTAAQARSAPASAQQRALDARSAAVRDLLQRRGAAVLARDLDAFLADLDPAAVDLRRRQSELFAALAEVPLGTWQYVLDDRSAEPDDRRLDEEYGAGSWWAPDVVLQHAIAGYDTRPTLDPQHLTFVERDGRWLLAADDDFAAVGRDTTRLLWDLGPVVAERRDEVLVLGRPGDRSLLRDVARQAAQAVPRVSRVWGEQWRRGLVVVVPGSAQEMDRLLDGDGDLSRIAAVATAELTGGAEFDPAGDRVLVNPGTFPGLGGLGRQVVLTHEVTHVASRAATGPGVPSWLAEGLADHVAYLDVDLPLAVSARELRADVRAGAVPEALPTTEDFDGGNPALPQAYEQAWLAVRMLVDRYGQGQFLRFYRATGALRGLPPEQAVEQTLQSVLGTTTAQVTADWQALLRRELG